MASLKSMGSPRGMIVAGAGKAAMGAEAEEEEATGLAALLVVATGWQRAEAELEVAAVLAARGAGVQSGAVASQC